MSRNQQTFISTFCDLTGCCKEEATLYAKRFSNIDDAINRYYDNPLPFTPPKPVIPKAVASVDSTHSHKFIKTFENHLDQHHSMVDDDVDEFYNELNITSSGKIDYILFFVSGAKHLRSFTKDDILRICKTIPFSGEYEKDILNYYDEKIKKGMNSFLSKIYSGLMQLINRLNVANGIHDRRSEKELEKSHQEHIEGMIVLVDLLEDVYAELYDENYVKNNKCFVEYLNYIMNVRKIQSLDMDNFTFIDIFLNKFRNLNDLVMDEDKVDDLAMNGDLTCLAEDFIRHFNKLPPAPK